MTATTNCFSAIAGGKIDRSAGIISGVTVITANVPAKGHGIYTDAKTLQTTLEVANEFKGGVKVKLRHKMSGEFQSVVENTIGVIKDFFIAGDKLRGDLHLLKSLESETKEKIYEMAEVMPDQFGLSIHFSGVCETFADKKYLRCEELQSIDLSDNPAANPDGLFESKPMSKEIKYKSGDAGEHHAECMCGKCESESMSKKMSALESTIIGLVETVKGLAGKAVGALSYKDKDGKEVTLEAGEIVAKLAEAEAASKKATDAALNGERKTILAKLESEGRVVFNADTGVAYTAKELESLDIAILKFASKNSPVIPLEARAIYKGDAKPKIDSKLKGSDLVHAAWEADYGDINKLLRGN